MIRLSFNFPGFKDSRWAFKLQDSLMLNKTSIIIDWAEVSDAMVLRDIPGEITAIVMFPSLFKSKYYYKFSF